MSLLMVSSNHSRLISEWENRVKYNLSESGVSPLSLSELSYHGSFLERLHERELGYPQTNGILQLREGIASLYSNVSAEQIVVTIGAAQANFLTTVALLEPGDEILMILPTYQQLNAIGRRFGYPVRTVTCRVEDAWVLDLDAVRQAVTERTRLIYVCNPNNPTGRVLTLAEMGALVDIADKCGAWLLADEVFRGSEWATGETTPSFWGFSDRVIATNSLSKAYGLPGTRIGWVVSPLEVADRLWAAQDIITICAGMLENYIAAYALQPDVCSRLYDRTRQRIRKGYARLAGWLGEYKNLFRLVTPQAGAFVLVGYPQVINSSELANRLIYEKSTLLVPGDGFGLDYHVRISLDVPETVLVAGLQGLVEILQREVEKDGTDCES